MKEIEIHYKPIKLLPWTRSFKVNIPTQLSELTEKQFITCASFINFTLPEATLLSIFLNINSRSVKNLDESQKESVKKLLHFISEPGPLDTFIIKSVAFWYKAPLPQLKNITFKAFVAGDFYYQGRLRGEEKYSNWFIPYFYYKDSGFIESWVGAYTLVIETEHKKVLDAIAVNYGLIRKTLKNEFPLVFSFVEEMERIHKDHYGFEHTIIMFSNYKVLNKEKFENQPVKQALTQLENFIYLSNQFPGNSGLSN